MRVEHLCLCVRRVFQAKLLWYSCNQSFIHVSPHIGQLGQKYIKRCNHFRTLCTFNNIRHWSLAWENRDDDNNNECMDALAKVCCTLVGVNFYDTSYRTRLAALLRDSLIQLQLQCHVSMKLTSRTNYRFSFFHISWLVTSDIHFISFYFSNYKTFIRSLLTI